MIVRPFRQPVPAAHNRKSPEALEAARFPNIDRSDRANPGSSDPQGTDPDGQLTADGQFVRSGVSTVSREEGQRLVAIKFSVRGRDLASAVNDAQVAVRKLIPAGYRDEWSGEFKNMEEGEGRLLVIVPMSLFLVFLLLYLAFNSLLDATTVLMNVVSLSLGGIWALFITGTNFSIAAAVGFTSIFGVAIMGRFATDLVLQSSPCSWITTA